MMREMWQVYIHFCNVSTQITDTNVKVCDLIDQVYYVSDITSALRHRLEKVPYFLRCMATVEFDFLLQEVTVGSQLWFSCTNQELVLQ